MVSNVAHSYRAYLAMEDTKANAVVPERIRFEVQDEEQAAASKRPTLGRSATAISEDSVHLRPGSRRSSMAIEPAAGLPIQYRTL